MHLSAKEMCNDHKNKCRRPLIFQTMNYVYVCWVKLLEILKVAKKFGFKIFFLIIGQLLVYYSLLLT